MTHREPPYPEHFRKSVEPGCCRWCGLPIDKAQEPRAQCWHKACVKEYRIIAFPDFGKEACAERSGYKCAICGQEFDHIQVWHQCELDHIIPLAICPRELRYWGLENLQILCHDCHARKTALDIWRIKRFRATAAGEQVNLFERKESA